MNRFLVALLFVLLTQEGYCCSCDEPSSVRESLIYSDLVLYGRVISLKKVSAAQTIDADRLRGQKLQSTHPYVSAEQYLRHPLILEARIEVIKNYKGGSVGKIITVFTPIAGASCGYRDFLVRKDFVVYGYRQSFFLNFIFSNYEKFPSLGLSNTFWTDQCSRTTQADKQKLKELEEALLMKHKP